MKSVTVDEAIARGNRFVNWPVRGFLVAPAVLYFLGHKLLGAQVSDNTIGFVCVIAFGVCFVLAWLWWSVHVPKWRLWAYERVTDIAELKRRAILAQLTWPDGSIFARTEIKSAAHAAREREFERGAKGDAAT